MPSFEQRLSQYAEVIIRVGLNLQPGQRLLIGTAGGIFSGAPLEALPLVRELTKQAYKAGARYVDVIWEAQELQRLRYEYAPRDSFEEVAAWKVNATVEYGKRGDALLAIFGSDPDLLAGQDPELIATQQQAAFANGQPVLELIGKSATNWLVVSVPIPGWTAKVLPDVPADQQEAVMWDTLFDLCRIKGDNPVADWQAHVANMMSRATYLNQKQYAALKYTAPGTDLKVGLPAGHIWHSARLNSQNGISFVANIPTEEVFTLPHRDQVDGVVTATRPLSYGGTTIDNFSLTFQGGRVTEVSASGAGEVVLLGLLDTDDNARRLGEVALVPHSSPISQSNRLFYNILYDENASNHMALGNAYRFNLTDGEGLTPEQFAAAGGNSSLIHVDFMMGSEKMDVDGITANGESEPLMRAGEWAFTV